MPWLTSAEVKQAVADALQSESVTVLSPRWDRLVIMATDDAKGDITDHFIGRGYTLAQIEDWDRLASLHRLQSLYWAFVHGANIHSFNDQWVEKWDQRKAMADMVITQDTGVIDAGGIPAFVQVGTFDTTNDRWTRDTPV